MKYPDLCALNKKIQEPLIILFIFSIEQRNESYREINSRKELNIIPDPLSVAARTLEKGDSFAYTREKKNISIILFKLNHEFE